MPGYRVIGPESPHATFSGVVCDLEKPFTIEMLNTDINVLYPFQFNPSTSTDGTFSAEGTKLDFHWTGSGSYIIEGVGTEKVTIVAKGAGCLKVPDLETYCEDYDWFFELIPLDMDECSQP